MFRIPIHNKNYKLLILVFYMAKNLWKALTLLLGISIISTLGIATKPEELRESPKEIRVDSLQKVRQKLINFHRGVKGDFRNDYDWDRDGINDIYLEAKDGTVYSTHSKDHPENTNDLFTAKFYKHKREK